jgi:hypothetical protein
MTDANCTERLLAAYHLNYPAISPLSDQLTNRICCDPVVIRLFLLLRIRPPAKQPAFRLIQAVLHQGCGIAGCRRSDLQSFV